MKPFLVLLPTLFTMMLSAQSTEIEDALLRERMDEGKLPLTEYRRQADRLRITIGTQRGYPNMPTDVDGNFYLETNLSTGLSQLQNWQLIRQWVIKAGLTYDEQQAYFDESGGKMVMRVSSRYIHTDKGKQLISTDERWAAAPFEIKWLMEVTVADQEIVIRWQEPSLEEFVVEREVIFDGGGVYVRTIETLFHGLLPLVNHHHDSWNERLRQAKLMVETITTAERSLLEYAGAEVE